MAGCGFFPWPAGFETSSSGVEPTPLGRRLPTLPLWLSDSFAVPLELEESYQQSCRDLRIP